jgi:spermidine/putrescine-binding protein
MKKLLLLLALVLVATAVFAGGQQEAKEAEGAEEAAEVKTLRVAAPPWIFKKFDLENFSTEFDNNHPELKLEMIRADKWSAPTYITEWETGSTPFDVFVGGSGSMLAPIITGEWTEPMDSMLTGDLAKDNFVGGFLAAGKYKKSGGGSYYPCIPFVGEVSIIGVNTEILKDAGLWQNGKPAPIPSWNEDDFFNWFSKVNDSAELGAHVQIWDREFMQYDYCGPIKAMTGTFMEENGKGFDVTSDAAKKWLRFLQKMHDEGMGVWTTTDDQGYAKWKTGQTGSFYAAQGHIMELVSVTEDESDIAYLGWPDADKNGSIIWTHSVWMPKVAKNKDLGKAYIREVVFSKEMQQWSFNNYGKLPVMKDYYGEGITWFQDQMPVILAVADASSPIPLFGDLQEYLDILFKYLPEAVYGRMDVNQALNKIQQESSGLDFSDLRAR